MMPLTKVRGVNAIEADALGLEPRARHIDRVQARLRDGRGAAAGDEALAEEQLLLPAAERLLGGGDGVGRRWLDGEAGRVSCASANKTVRRRN